MSGRFDPVFAGMNEAGLPGWRRQIVVVTAGLSVVWLMVMPVFAEAEAAAGDDLAWAEMTIKMLGGLALFLYGMEQMGDALKAVAGDKLRDILGKLTTNRLMGLLTGSVVTAIIQSSSVTTVMLVGFVTAGLMSLSQAVGVILGADIGTTITAQIVAFPIKKYALLLVAVGFVMLFIGKRDKIKQYGILIMGLGLIFFGMSVMSSAMSPLRSFDPFIELMRNVDNPAIGILVSAAFTGLVQSSSATMGVVIVLASQGVISLEGGIALALGANIGTCATAGLASIGKPREAVRVAVAHVTFKIVGVLLIVWFIPPFADFVRDISPASTDLTGADRLAADTPRQVANAHTLFNVGIAFVFLPVAGLFARFCEWVVPDRPIAAAEAIAMQHRPKYLDDVLLDTPVLALDRARMEIGRIGGKVSAMYDSFLEPALARDVDRLEEIAEMDTEIDDLHAHVISYLGKVSTHELGHEETEELVTLMQAANQLEQLGDIVETNLVRTGTRMIEEEVTVGKETAELIGTHHEQIGQALRDAIAALGENDADLALQVRRMKPEMARRTQETIRHAIERLSADEPNRLRTYTREMELVENLNRVFRLSRSLAKLVLPRETAAVST